MSERRVWKCSGCKRQFSVITGTIMQGTKISVRSWVFVIFEMCASKNGVAAREIERKYGICPRSAWFMLHRVREAMKRDGLVSMMRGTVAADETFIGGRESNKHYWRRWENTGPTQPQLVLPGTIGPRGRPEGGRPPAAGKTIVLTLIDKATGEARSRVIPNVTGHTLRKAISEQVDMASTTLHTDEALGYKAFASEFLAHETVNHKQDEYVRYVGNKVITSNQAENFFSQLKRSLDGTHHHVSKQHLSRYLAEFDFRFSTRKASDAERMARLMGTQLERRLTYKRTVADARV